MCGRFAIGVGKQVIEKYFGETAGAGSLFEALGASVPAYNLAPSQRAPVLTPAGWELPVWGLRPSWARLKGLPAQFNARLETATERAYFRSAFGARHCVVPMTGWFEWKVLGKSKQPHYVSRSDGHLIGLAGLWEEDLIEETGELLRTFTILTKEPTPKLSELHHRMPVVLLAGFGGFNGNQMF